MAFYQQQPFYNPKTPFKGSIQGGLQDGKSIIISGRVLPQCDRFHVNLQCGSHSNADIALHFNPRYEVGSGYVVNNTQQNGQWGSEERKYEAPFPIGQPFTLQILITQSTFKISTNGRHFTDFRHRIAFTQVDTLSVDGRVELTSIAFQNPAPCLPSQPGFPRRKSHSGKKKMSLFATPPSYQSLVYPPAVSYSLPFKTIINGGLFPGKNIIIQGVINHGADRIAFNLRHRSGIALHYNPRFNENVVVRNSHHMENWGAEERFGSMPFKRGQPFQVTISCNPYHFNVFVNGNQAHTFNHRFTALNEIDILEVTGDLQLSLVQA